MRPWALGIAIGLLCTGRAVAAAPPDSTGTGGLVYLVPSLEENGYRITGGSGRLRNRISLSPAVGQLGANSLFSFRAGFSPNSWLEYEVSFGHNPSASLHALLHTFNVILRYPRNWRALPYATFGYGMMTVYPGQAVNANPVTKNSLLAGGGLEFYIRDDVALRGELRGVTVLGQQLGVEGTVAYDYLEYTIGFAFYRSLGM